MKYHRILLIVLTFTIYFGGYSIAVVAQTIPAGTNVDQYSDAQIKQLLQQAQAQGLSDAQIVQQAQARGLSADQAAHLQQRISAIRKTQGSGTFYADTSQNQPRGLNYTPDTLSSNKQNTDIFKNLRPKIFGADLFRNSNIGATPNLNIATPVNYILGPTDQLNIDVYGNSLASWRLKVSPEGNINIPGVGPLNVAGKTVEQATANIKSKLAANNYAIGRGTSVDVNLGNIKSISVVVVGEVLRPNTYILPSLSTVFGALNKAGGPSDNGTFRQIDIIRNGKIFRHLDLYDFLTKGDQKDNIMLKDQDIIRVPTYRTRIELAGEVKIPALFETLPGETLQDIIKYAGGFTDQAYTDRIKVIQISGQQYRISDVVESDYKNYVPLRGDKYIVEHILNRFENRVTINGAVFRPGEYELQNGLTLSQLIKNAAGLKEDAFTGRGSITRLKPDNTTEQLSFDVLGIVNKTVPDIVLQREDIVEISSMFDLRDKYTVDIKGEVRRPGQFAYADKMTIQDLIIKAGGFAEGASPKRIEVARRVNNSNPLASNSAVAQVFTQNVDANLKTGGASFVLKPYDIVSIYTLPGYEPQKTVKVEGEVLYPGNYTIKTKNEKISDIITRAGGLTASADVDGGTLKRSNIAILGVDKNKVDTTGIEKERTIRLNRLQKGYNDTTVNKTNSDAQLRNDYVGIDLKKILEQPGSNIDLILEDGDNIRIPKQQQIVRVNGEVLYPSAVVFEKGKTFSSYVSNAGGFSPKALKRGAYVVYPNGTVKGTRKFLFFNSHPAVKAGSEIYVPVKPEKKGLGATELVGISTGIASLGAIILGILSLHKSN
ncbi:SLBB domain-containing protein [Mucilaginibacter boryungensis]|uniref:SLBB domain-containing protein n=1 Tax=Mucilaginibacter boryungensis TaxID=768480 RepID=A0ABR9XFN0_9SPHI|nr:SLBB domain-containing protein [Mucilaginibacter boryungensis]MBE9665833.1 SLBB domain-containing protein [Mucilaginibacter boryungensis]